MMTQYNIQYTGNFCSNMSLAVSSPLRKKKTNYFIVSLAFADLLVALVVMPFAAIELTTGQWRYGEIFCLVRTSLDVLLTTASILHLCCIALDRFVRLRERDDGGFDKLRFFSGMLVAL